MNWEAFGAISTALTGVVILLTVIFAARQVRALNQQSQLLTAQLDHLRRATQLDGTMQIFEQLMAPEFNSALHFVMTEFEERMKDERFHAEAVGPSPDAQTHGEVNVMRNLERIGTLIRNGLLESDVVLDYAGAIFSRCWNKLRPLVLEQREVNEFPALWENFEYLATDVQRFRRERSGSGRADLSSSPFVRSEARPGSGGIPPA